MNAIDGFEVLLAGLSSLPIAAGIAWLALKALVGCILENGTARRSTASLDAHLDAPLGVTL
jgi:hypothetical protein